MTFTGHTQFLLELSCRTKPWFLNCMALKAWFDRKLTEKHCVEGFLNEECKPCWVHLH